jgi:hypothetical protein
MLTSSEFATATATATARTSQLSWCHSQTAASTLLPFCC